MAHETHEIGTKLTLDDEASEALKHVSEGFEHVKEHVHEVGHEMVGMAKQAAAFAIGFQLEGAIESVKELGHELVEGALKLEDQKKELAGLIAMTGKGEDALEDLGGKASELNEKLEGMAIQTGATKEQMIDAFETIAQRSTKSSGEIAEMVGQMSEAARVLPGGMERMAGAWRDLEAGFVRPKNALVQLMKQAGVVEGDSRKIAKGLNSMIQAGKTDEVFKLAEQAMSRMATKMKDVPLTFSQLLTSARDFREMFFEGMGAPMLAAIAPSLERLRGYLIAHREEIARVAKVMGERVGEWAKKAADEVQEAFEYLETHADEIFDALEKGAKALKEAVSFVVDHRDLLLAIFAVNKGAGLMGKLGGTEGLLAGAGTLAGRAVGAAGRNLGGVGETPWLNEVMGTSQMGTNIAAAGALAVIDVALIAAVKDQAGKLEKESGMSTTDAFGHVLGGMFGFTSGLAKASGDLASFRAEVAALSDPARQSAAGLRHTQRALEEFGNAVESGGASSEIVAEVERMKKAAAQKAAAAEQLAAAEAQLELTAVAGYDSGFVGPQLDVAHRFALVYEQMSALNGTAAEEAARKILEGNDVLLHSLSETGDVGEALKKLKDTHGGKMGDGFNPPPMNFGPSTFNIQQNFREADPDRVAIVFRRDIGRHSTARVGAKTGAPFG